MTYIYVIKLESDKYYIGKTGNPKFRLESHFNNSGSEWTKKYKPIDTIEIIESNDIFDEDKITLKYMNLYGIDNVRGGSFAQIILNQASLETINKMLSSSNNTCFNCNKNDHFVKDCPNPKKYNCKYCNKEFSDVMKKNGHQNLYCKHKNKEKDIIVNQLVPKTPGYLLAKEFYNMLNEDNTITEVKKGITGDIIKNVNFLEGEMPLYYYTDVISIILTNRRFIKLENNKIISEVYLDNILYVNHISGGLLHFDKIEIIDNNKKITTFGIYSKKICLYFIKLIKELLVIIKNP